MKMMKKRLISLLLVLALCLSMAAPALAGDMSDEAVQSAPVSAQTEEPVKEEKEESKSEETEESKTEEKDESKSEEQKDESDAEQEDSQEQEEESQEKQEDSDEERSEEQPSDAPAPAESGQEDEDAEDSDEDSPAVQAPAPALEKDALTLTVGKSAQVKLLDGTVKAFGSSDAEVVTVDQQGKVTAQKVGQADVIVTDDQGELFTCAVTVEATVTRSEAKMTVGKSVELTLENRTLAKAVSSNPAVVTVDKKGKANALKAGTAELTLTDTLGDLHVCTVKVKAVLSDKSLTLSETKTARLSFTGSPIVKAVSSNAEIASVDGKGLVTANKAGSAVLTFTDASGSKSKCKVTVDPNYLARSAAASKKVYNKIVALHCRHSGGTRSYAQLLKRRKITCGTGVSVALQEAGLLKKGDVITHTTSGSEKRKLSKPSGAIKNLGRLKKGTYTLYKANCSFSKLPAKYKAAGMVYVQASNICISAGNGFIYTTNESSRQYRHGHYFKTRMNKGYTHRHKILFVIAPKS